MLSAVAAPITGNNDVKRQFDVAGSKTRIVLMWSLIDGQRFLPPVAAPAGSKQGTEVAVFVPGASCGWFSDVSCVELDAHTKMQGGW